MWPQSTPNRSGFRGEQDDKLWLQLHEVKVLRLTGCRVLQMRYTETSSRVLYVLTMCLHVHTYIRTYIGV